MLHFGWSRRECLTILLVNSTYRAFVCENSVNKCWKSGGELSWRYCRIWRLRTETCFWNCSSGGKFAKLCIWWTTRTVLCMRTAWRPDDAGSREVSSRWSEIRHEHRGEWDHETDHKSKSVIHSFREFRNIQLLMIAYIEGRVGAATDHQAKVCCSNCSPPLSESFWALQFSSVEEDMWYERELLPFNSVFRFADRGDRLPSAFVIGKVSDGDGGRVQPSKNRPNVLESIRLSLFQWQSNSVFVTEGNHVNPLKMAHLNHFHVWSESSDMMRNKIHKDLQSIVE
jgi:hypothetical protein